jgi:Pyruvate/2-oxoacid:ferredoxin oxidoreductase delta subunit
MRRKIISIDDSRCTGCGQCIPDCPEGALQLIDGKARLVSDLFCDGLGACIGTCPEGAITIIEREAGGYDEKAVMDTIVRQGEPVIRAHLEHLTGHGQTDLYHQAIDYMNEHKLAIQGHKAADCSTKRPEHCHPDFAGCPGSAARSIARGPRTGSPPQPSGTTSSELRQWPVQLTLLNPGAAYFENADLLISADCVPFAYAGFHNEILRGKILIIFCPKLDSDIEGYITKLAEIVSGHNINSITVVHMEVPCCSGVRYVVDQALEKSGKTVPVKDYTITISGEIK